MIRSVAHPSSRNWHKAHKARARRSWWIVGVIVVLTLGAFFAQGYFAQVGWGELSIGLLHTLYRLILAYGLALVVGVVLALIVGSSLWAIDFFFPFFDVLQNIPSFALIPLFIYFFGYGDTMIVLFAVSSIVWPILFAVLTAIKSAHTDLNDAATIFGARGFKRIIHYLAPLSSPLSSPAPSWASR